MITFAEGLVPPDAMSDPAMVRKIGFFLIDNFSLMSFASALETLRVADRLSGRQNYQRVIVTKHGKPAISSSRVAVAPNCAMADTGTLDRLIVVGGVGTENYHDTDVYSTLRRWARSGCEIGAVSSGSYLLAHAGLLDGYRCTIHWENIEGFVERFPTLEVSDELFVIDRDRFTCSGGTASLDLMLVFIEADHGRDLAVTVADQFIHKDSRDTNNQQRMALRLRLGASHPKLLAAAGLMESNLEEPLKVDDIARQLNFTVRQLQRLFRNYLQCTPKQYYLDARLARAQRMLLQSTLSVLQVAVACGFVSASHFSKTYRNRYGVSPRQGRETTKSNAAMSAAISGG